MRIILSTTLAFLFSFLALGQCEINKCIEVISVDFYESYKSRKIAFLSPKNTVDTNGNIFIKGQPEINVELFLHCRKKKQVEFPYYYWHNPNNTYVLTEATSVINPKYTYVLTEATSVINPKYTFKKIIERLIKSEVLNTKSIKVKSVEKKKNWELLEYTDYNVHSIELIMTIGCYNKLTRGCKLIGDFDEKIKVNYILQ
mgnify:CR=1 FL=1